VVAVLLGAVFAGESISPVALVALALILGGVALVATQRSSPEPVRMAPREVDGSSDAA
jgi:drug/metabolite transporter (DMT)-like permease